MNTEEKVPTSHRQKWERWEESILTRLKLNGADDIKIAKKLKRTPNACRTRWNVIKSCNVVCGTCQISTEAHENETVLAKRLAQDFGIFINNTLSEKKENMGMVSRKTNPNKFFLTVTPVVNTKSGEAFVQFSGMIPLDYTKIRKNTVKSNCG